jgi:hypothetical protein
MPMKISRSVIERFKEQEENAIELRRVLGFRISEWCKSNNWLYVDRIKKDESYAQKIEQSRSDKIDDVYAGTVIVKNRLDVKDCCEHLEKDKTLGIEFKHKLPPNLETSSFSAETFTFDSVRMYFKASKPDIDSAYYHLNKVFERQVFGEVFEIQIKTLLDEAWGKASHDFSYKTDGNLSWAKSRLMFQIKALLENAEMALSDAELLSEAKILQKSDDRLNKLNNIMHFYRENWDTSLLPNDMRRLAENTRDLLGYLYKDLDWLITIIELETAAGRGSNIMNLSPYWIVVQSIIEKMGWDTFLKKINKTLNDKNKHGKKNIFPIIRELECPENINLDDFPHIRNI